MAEQQAPRTYRLRDPVHGLIVFEEDRPLDQLAWALMNTPEFQRLRRIRQLGVSEFVFPGATHTRFAHSIGVFHNARMLVKVIEREMRKQKQEPDSQREEEAIIAALLHDLGHGPFSHTFEGVQKSRGIKKRHELWTADIIRNPKGKIKSLLDGFRKDENFCEKVASLLASEDPTDIYHAVVSSSFDADRLDYLRRDRMMTGTGAGAIDFDWLMEHVRVGEIYPDVADEGYDDAKPVATFCLDAKALPAAEQFLLARYTLHQQVYFHKTTRCAEKMIAKLLRGIASHCDKLGAAEANPKFLAKTSEEVLAATGLPISHPLIQFLSLKPEDELDEVKRAVLEERALASYLQLDDTAIVGSFDEMRMAKDGAIKELARRLQERDLYKTFDLASVGEDAGKQAQRARQIDKMFDEKLKSGAVIKDEEAAISIYTQIGGDDERAHKKLHVFDAGKPTEIVKVSPLVQTLGDRKPFTRYYFESDSDRQVAKMGKAKK
jgi:uncharacterized protein